MLWCASCFCMKQFYEFLDNETKHWRYNLAYTYMFLHTESKDLDELLV